MAFDDAPTRDDRRRASAHVLLDADSGDDLTAAVVPIPGDAEHHLARVLRLRDGEAVSVTDGHGAWRMTAWRAGAGSLEATSEIQVETRATEFALATAIPKGDRVDTLVQKATELGVARIVLLHAERSVVRWKPARALRQLERLERIADEAVRQSRRVWRVAIDGPTVASDVLVDAAIAEPGGAPLTGADRLVAIGPEGGWTDAELALAGRRVTLGDAILRTETAGIAACALSMTLHH